jgi:hypothetical protein
VGRYGDDVYYFAIFAGAHPADATPDAALITREEVALLAPSLDALLHHGVWPIVGHAQPTAVVWPTYKEMVSPPDRFEAVDYTGAERRPATPREASELPFRKVVAPIRVQNALQALYGVRDWDASFDSLRYETPPLL